MTDEPKTTDTGGTVWDAPNQQTVREDGSPPWEEGTGGGGGPDPQNADTDVSLDEMTKDELLAYAQELGVSPANASMTKDELRAGIDAKQSE
jgi:hypothetical protein